MPSAVVLSEANLCSKDIVFVVFATCSVFGSLKYEIILQNIILVFWW